MQELTFLKLIKPQVIYFTKRDDTLMSKAKRELATRITNARKYITKVNQHLEDPNTKHNDIVIKKQDVIVTSNATNLLQPTSERQYLTKKYQTFQKEQLYAQLNAIPARILNLFTISFKNRQKRYHRI